MDVKLGATFNRAVNALFFQKGKYILLVLLIAWTSCNSAAQRTIAPYAVTKIVYSGDDNEAIKDIRNVLREYKAGTITISKTALDNRTGQEFYLGINGNETVIKYTTQTSLENAIYTYLDMLGFRWYGPGDNWFVKPGSIVRSDFSGRWLKPTFRNRQFFGTGGLDMPPPHLFDPQNKYKANWYTWKRRNRFNADFVGVGHTGQAFYQNNKNLLDAHPEWFSGETGKINGRLKIDEPAAVNAYKQWIKRTYRSSPSTFTAIGVDPEDGRGGADDPLPAKNASIKNHADKWWWVANEVAKEYPENDKTVVITANAYGDGPSNALTPSFALRKNVYPVIIPYAFQTAYLPEEMVRAWAAKVTGNMGIYDYWNITQWSQGTPQFNIYSIAPKLKFWSQNKIDGIYLETTDAAGPMGHSLWLAGQLQWDLNKDFDRLYKQYLDDCFGKAALAMKQLFDRWSTNYQGAGDVSLSLNDLQKAAAMVAANGPEWKRINELKAYVHYLKLYYEHDGTQQSKDRLIHYLYSIHHLMMVQTAAFIGQHYILPLDKGNILPDGKNIKPLTENDIEEQFKKDLRATPLKYNLTGFQFDYDKVGYIQAIDEQAWRFGGASCNFFFKAPFTGQLQIDAGAEFTTPFNLFTNDKVIVKEIVGNTNFDYKEKLGDRTWSMKRFRVSIIKGKTYSLRTTGGFSRVKMITPGVVLFKNPGGEDFDNYQYPLQYFYVPADVKELVFYDAQPEGANGRGYIINPDGKAEKRESIGVKDTYRIPVDPSHRGKVWIANFGHPVWSFKNIPNISSLQLFRYVE